MSDSIGPLNRSTPSELRETYERRARARLLGFRRELGLSQQRFAAVVGAHSTQIENYERGASRVPAWILEAAAARVRGEG